MHHHAFTKTKKKGEQTVNSTLEELVAQRRGYKYLSKEGVSPYQNHKYNLKSKKKLITNLDKNKSQNCGAGWNLATLKWIADNCLKLNGVFFRHQRKYTPN